MIVTACGAALHAATRAPTLVPSAPATATPSYWCTWDAQNYALSAAAVRAANETGAHSGAAAALTEANVFGPQGWAAAFPQVRRDLYLMFDLGWDTPPGLEFDNARWLLGSHLVDATKFPSCQGTPAQRLRKLDEITRRAGWRAAAIWIPAQAQGDGKDGKLLDAAALENYFRERLRRTRDAGIGYWKVDYGARAGDSAFRAWLTRLAEAEAPGLLLEHARCGGPFNDELCPWDKSEYTGRGDLRAYGHGEVLREDVRIIEASQIFRTYDVTAQLSVPTTLERVAQMLAECAGKPAVRCVLNCEDESYIAAVLGCATGVQRHPRLIDPENTGYDPRRGHQRLDEITRAVRWQRIAPAVPAGAVPIQLDAARLTDSWHFRKGETWASWVWGRDVLQSAPARVARNMPLPKVSGPEAPSVIASRHPNGALSVATLTRASASRGFYYPLAQVELAAPAALPLTLGVFGFYERLALVFTDPLPRLRVLAQDLAADTAADITAELHLEGRRIVFPGDLLKRVGLSAASSGDASDPGSVLRLEAV
ncbi:MAG: hypothetical protein ACLQBJ_11610 [Bryobacteraceae bacterium]